MSNEAAERLEPRDRDIIVHDLMGAGYDEAVAEKLVAAALAAERKATVDGIEALRHLFFVMERLDRQASEPSPDHFVKITVEAWRDLVTPAIRAVRAILDAEAER